MRTYPHRRSGFTLLETLVTLVIISLLITVLMQALSYSLGLRERMLRYHANAKIALLQEQWFRESVESAIADLPEAMGNFTGDAQQLAFVTGNPLGGQGVDRAHWTLVPDSGGVLLRYRDSQLSQITLVDTPLQEAAFSYLDPEGNWHDHWPLERSPQWRLPRLVRFEARTTSGSLVWWVSVAADPHGMEKLKMEEVFGG